MTQTLHIRQAQAEDAGAISAITRDAFALYAEQIGQPGRVSAQYETTADVQQDMESKLIYVAEQKGEILGSVRFSLYKREGIAYISRLCTTPRLRGGGIGGRLVAQVMAVCAQMGVRAVALHTASAMQATVGFYLKHGFYLHSDCNGEDYDRVLMVKELCATARHIDYTAALHHMGGRKPA